MRIEGSVAPGFESVEALFRHNMHTLAEDNAQLCVYVGNSKVVDLWATADSQRAFDADSLVNVFSSGKSLESIAIATLVSAGLLDYGAAITDYWPAFGARGKGHLTVADLMRHEAGLAAFEVSIDPDHLLPHNIRENRVGEIIENHPPHYRQGTASKREYHAVTRGWIVNELFRRVDPKARTVGEFLREEVSGPLGMDVYVGLPEDQLGRVVPTAALGAGFYFRESLRPRGRRKVSENFFHLSGKLLRLAPSLRHRTGRNAAPPFLGLDTISAFNDPRIVMGETPSANAHCSARGLAKLASVMASGGSGEQNTLMSQAAWQAMHDAPVRSDMGIHTNFTQGGVALFGGGPYASVVDRGLNEGREGFYGWMGLGGSLFQWHPEHRIGFAFVPTTLHVIDFLNERGKAYQAEVVRCVRALQGPG
ncbi:MAG: serine hydrolase domain-containing protein [Pseudomonadota bacterium]